MMRKLMRAANVAALIHTGAAFAADGEIAAPYLPLDLPASTASIPPYGGWTADGWSDDVPANTAGLEKASEERAARAGSIERKGEIARVAPADDGWRRETWDGGRGRVFRYARGRKLDSIFSDPAYGIPDWRGYGLASPPAGAVWVRYFDDAVLLDRAGTVIDAAPRIDWTQAAHAKAVPGERGAWQEGASYTFQATPGTTVHRLPDGRTVTITTVMTRGTASR